MKVKIAVIVVIMVVVVMVLKNSLIVQLTDIVHIPTNGKAVVAEEQFKESLYEEYKREEVLFLPSVNRRYKKDGEGYYSIMLSVNKEQDNLKEVYLENVTIQGIGEEYYEEFNLGREKVNYEKRDGLDKYFGIIGEDIMAKDIKAREGVKYRLILGVSVDGEKEEIEYIFDVVEEKALNIPVK